MLFTPLTRESTALPGTKNLTYPEQSGSSPLCSVIGFSNSKFGNCRTYLPDKVSTRRAISISDATTPKPCVQRVSKVDIKNPSKRCNFTDFASATAGCPRRTDVSTSFDVLLIGSGTTWRKGSRGAGQGVFPAVVMGEQSVASDRRSYRLFTSGITCFKFGLASVVVQNTHLLRLHLCEVGTPSQ